MKGHKYNTELPPMPTDAVGLAAMLKKNLGIDVPGEAMLPGSDSPLDYLAHSFFEGHMNHATATIDTERASVTDCVVWANRGGGKTYLGAVATLLDLVYKDGIEVCILAGSLEQGARMYQHLRGFFERAAFKKEIKGRMTERRIVLRSGSRVEILAASETSIRGTRVQKIRCDEVELFKPELLDAVQLATRSERCGGEWGGPVRGTVECLSTMHRPNGVMWNIVSSAARKKDLAGVRLGDKDESRARRVLFRWGIVDTLEHCPPKRACDVCVLLPECQRQAKKRNPGGHVGIDDACAAKGRVSLATWKSEMLCERPTRTHSVLPEFNPDVHVFGREGWEGGWNAGLALGPDGTPSGTVICGMDFGFREPTVVLWGVVGRDGVLRIVEERVERERTTGEHIEAIRAARWKEPAWIGADPAGSARNEQTGVSSITLMRRAGLVVRARRSALQDGVSYVRARLAPAAPVMPEWRKDMMEDEAARTGKPFSAEPAAVVSPRLFIHARCTTLIESMAKYHYPEDDLSSMKPVKDGSDHAVDALRYMIHNLDRPWNAKRGSIEGEEGFEPRKGRLTPDANPKG